MAIILVLIFVITVVLGSVKLDADELSLGELSRRAKKSATYARRLRRQNLLLDLIVIMQLAVAVLMISFVVTASVWLGWFGGFVVSIIAAAVYPVFTRLPGTVRLGELIYAKIEDYLMAAANKLPVVWRFFYGHTSRRLGFRARISSREELAELIKESGDILTSDEKQLVEGSISFGDKKIVDVMTPKSVIQSVGKDEFIGPLVLDELHSSGHGRLPVIDGDIDHVVGVLNLRSLLSLDVRKSAAASELMDKKVFFINQNDSLQKAMSAFVKQRAHLFIVVNDHRETVGLITLEDVIEALIGRSIVDENDVHEDMREVAKGKAKANNNGPNGTYL